MATLTVRNLPDEVHRALRTRAARHAHTPGALRLILLGTRVIDRWEQRAGPV